MNIRNAFDALDWLGRGFLTANEFRRAFEQQASLSNSFAAGGFLRQDSVEMEGMIRRFNKDKMNGRVSLPEFMDEFTPKCADKNY